jgi:TolA-binding protein
MSASHPNKTQKDIPVNEEWVQVKEAIQKHANTVFTVVLVVAVSAVAVWTILQRQEQKKLEAQQLLASAQSTVQFEDIVDRFPSSDAAPIAQLSLAKVHFDLGSYQEAMTWYDSFLEKWPEHPLKSTAVLGRLFSLEAMGSDEQIQQAEAGFRAFADANPDHYLYPQARLGEARCKQLLGQLEEARGIYEQFLATYPENPWVLQIEERLADLERKMGREQSS